MHPKYVTFIQCPLSNFKPGLYDLALLDMRMSKMYGHELYEEMKKTNDIVGLVSLNGGLRL